MMTVARAMSIGVIIVAIIALPYWFYLPLIFAAAVFFPLFWEGLLLAFFVDALYGEGVGLSLASLSFLSVSMLALLIALLPIRERIRPYA